MAAEVTTEDSFVPSGRLLGKDPCSEAYTKEMARNLKACKQIDKIMALFDNLDAKTAKLVMQSLTDKLTGTLSP